MITVGPAAVFPAGILSEDQNTPQPRNLIVKWVKLGVTIKFKMELLKKLTELTQVKCSPIILVTLTVTLIQ